LEWYHNGQLVSIGNCEDSQTKKEESGNKNESVKTRLLDLLETQSKITAELMALLKQLNESK